MTNKFPKYSLVVLIILFASCKKETIAPVNKIDTDYYIKFKRDGNWINYTGSENAYGQLGNDGSNPANIIFDITGQSANHEEYFGITIEVAGDTLPLSTYNSSYTATLPFISIAHLYHPSGAPTPQLYEIAPANGLPPSAYAITITEITSTTLKGNFTGNYLMATTVAGDTLTTAITEGEFIVKRNH